MCFSDTSDIKLTETDFESGQDSAILVRERTRGSKLEEKGDPARRDRTHSDIPFCRKGQSNHHVKKRHHVGHDDWARST